MNRGLTVSVSSLARLTRSYTTIRLKEVTPSNVAIAREYQSVSR